MREKTDFLKGIAILPVMLGHWFHDLVPSEIFIGGNGFVAIFFFLSGYGNYFSHCNCEKVSSSVFSHATKFYSKKIKRIYPLYWVALIPMAIMSNKTIGIKTVLAVNFTAPETYWFVPAIVFCYLVSPPIFHLMKSTVVGLLSVLSILILLSIYIDFSGVEVVRIWSYRGIFLNSLYLYVFGLLFARYNSGKSHNGIALLQLLLSIAFVVIIVETRFATLDFYMHDLVFNWLFTVVAALFCMSIVLGTFEGGSIVNLLGRHSYSLYLFHPIYFGVVRMLDFGDVVATSICLILFPLFVFGSAIVEMYVYRYMDSLWGKMVPALPNR